MLPAVRLNILKRREEFQWIPIIVHARCWVSIGKRIDLVRAAVFPTDDAARFVRRVATGLRDQLA